MYLLIPNAAGKYSPAAVRVKHFNKTEFNPENVEVQREVTVMIHSQEEYEKAVEASNILFGGATSEALRKLDEQTLLQVFEGVPQYKIARAELIGLPFIELCAERSDIFPSKGECRKMVQAGGVSLNKEKVADPMRAIAESDLIDGKYLLVQKGKKNYYLVIAE